MRHLFSKLARTLALAVIIAGTNLVSQAADAAAERARQCVATLQTPGATLFQKARACQQLGEIGGADAVPALAACLADEQLSAYARSGLEGIGGPVATAALREAVDKLKGNLRAGAVNSLGVLRDSQAVTLLLPLGRDPNSGLTAEALLALGRIATDDAVGALREALAKEPELLRTNAASGCLLAAEKRWADGQADQAIVLYDAVRAAQLPTRYQAAGLRGAILARGDKGISLLIEQLHASEPLFRQAALGAVRARPSADLAAALNRELAQASGNLAVLLLQAVADCHDTQSPSVVAEKLAASDVAVRKTALVVLCGIGGSAEAGKLLSVLTDSSSTEEAALASDALARMASVEFQILQALASAPNAAGKLRMIRLLEQRQQTNVVPSLLELAKQPEAKVAVAALRAVKSLANPSVVPELIAQNKTSQDDTLRAAIEETLSAVCTSKTGPDSGGAAVLSELKAATSPALKASWIRVLAAAGYAPALPDLLAALKDEALAATAATQLGQWPDPAPVEGLLAFAQATSQADLRQRAVASATALATVAAEERQRPVETLVAWLRPLCALAQTDAEKRAVISLLSRVPHGESFRLAVPYLDQPSLVPEASAAIVQLAPAVAKAEPAVVEQALDKVLRLVDRPELRAEAGKNLALIPGRHVPVSLFDGKSLAQWEGDTKVWQVRNGVITGGTLAGNPRNEFLATQARYTNFILRLEYRLVGSEGFVNGGVQFRSERLKEPANEMCGYQADIGAGYSGALYDESRRNKFLSQPAEALIKRLEKPGEWNRYEIRAQGRRMQIFLNGEPTVDYLESDAALPQNGLIGLQIHGGNKAEISFRYLTIEVLP